MREKTYHLYLNEEERCCIIKVDILFSRILIYNHNQYKNGRNNLWHKIKNVTTMSLNHRL